MAEMTFNTRIINKHDVYEQWQASSLVLKNGEVVVCTIPADTGAVQGEPVVMFKVGDGEKTFKDLPWTAARAADVYSWAKEPNKPTYEAKEITGIAAYIAEYVESEMGISVDTDTQYQVVKVDDYNYKLQMKGKGDDAWADVEGSTIVIPNDTEAINGLKALVGETSVQAQITAAIEALDLANTYDAKGAADDALAAAKEYADGLDEAQTEALNAYKESNNKALADEIARAKLAEGAAQKAADDAQADVDNLELAVGTPDEGKTVVQMIKDEAARADAAEKANAGLITEIQTDMGNVDNLETTSKELVGALNEVRNAVSAGGTAAAITIDTSATTDGALKSYTIKQGDTTVGTIDIPKDMVVESGEVVTDPEGQEAGTYIKLVLANVADPLYINVGHLVDIYKAKANATQIQLAIDSATREISASIVAGSVTATELAADAVTTVKIADANVTLAKLSTEVQTAIGKAHEHKNLELLETYTQTEANLADAVAKKHEHANAGVLDGITADKVAAWDASEQNAKDYADELVKDLDTYVKKDEAPGYGDILTKTDAATIYEPINAAKNAVEALDVEDAEVAGEFVVAVPQTDGKVAPVRRALADTDIPALAIEKITGLQGALDAKANDADLAAIAKTGNVNDLIQTAGDVLVCDCGDSTTV